MIDAVKYFVIYLIISTVVSIAVLILGYVVCAIVGQPLLGIEEMLDQPWILSISLLLTNLLVVFIFWKKKYARLGFDYGYTYGEGFSSKKLYQWLVVATVGLLLFDLMGGFYLPIPDESEVMQYLLKMMRNPIGFITVCFIGPFAEEVLFRGAIERRLLQKNWNPWFAIVISALIFALAHFNFAQAFTATVIGIFMGWVYYRTRSIWPGVLIHMTHNTIATILALASPETMANADFEMTLLSYTNKPENYNSNSDVETYRVTIRVEVKFYDNVKERIIYESKSLSADGVYDVQANETEDRHGQTRAVEKLQDLIVSNALAKW